MASSTESTEQAQSVGNPDPSTSEDESEDENRYYEGSEADLEEDKESSLEDGELFLIPNDFNVATINSFIERDIIKAPFYQRHYVWDLRKASLFIESILFGFPIPTIFLQDVTDGGRKRYDIIDGQQRLLTIYFYIKNKFPANNEARNALREEGKIKDIIATASNFKDFKLDLPEPHSDPIQSQKGHRKYHGYSYDELGEINDKPVQENFDLTTIPITTIKMDSTENSAGKIYEIYRRLNTGGVKLTPQQVRVAVYNSDFYTVLYGLNKEPSWRKITNSEHASRKMADIETLLRAAAFLMFGGTYKGSMVSFLNDYSYRMMQPREKKDIDIIKDIFIKFFVLSENLSFLRRVESKAGRTTKRFSIPTFEVIFVASCEDAWEKRDAERVKKIDSKKLESFLASTELTQLLSKATGSTSNINERLTLAKKYLS